MSKEEKDLTLVIENLENIINNPANNHLPISVMEIIETSVRLLKVESSQLTAYKKALRELWYDIHFTDISKEQIMDRIGSLIQPKP